MGYPKNGGFIRENPIQMDDLVVPLFQETIVSDSPIFGGPSPTKTVEVISAKKDVGGTMVKT